MPKSINDFLDQEQIDSIRQPIESALTLPSEAFTSEAFYQLEIEKIYKKHWVAALFDTEVAKPGDIRPFEVCEIPLLAVRGQDNEVRVFHNICPYDGSPAAIDPAEACAQIATPYHGWTYDLTGKLIKMPFWDGTREGNLEVLSGKEVDLIEVACGVFLNTIFVNLSDKPEAFEDYIAPVIQTLNEYDIESSVAGLDQDGETFISEGSVNTNWKTFFENACINVLHENYVHAFYNASPQLPRIEKDGVPSFKNCINGKLMALNYDREYFEETYGSFEAPHLGKDPEVEPKTENFGTLYPNFYISASSKFLEVAYALPNGPANTQQRAIYHYHKDLALSPEVHDQRKAISDAFTEAFNEDGRVTEALQKAKKSPVYKQKFYAPFWDEMHHHFSNVIVDDPER